MCSPARRLAVPMPPFQPKQLMPAPAPTAPSLEVGGSRAATAFATSAGCTCGDARVGEPAVVALADDGDHDVVDADARIGRDRDLDRAVVHAAHRVRRREVDRRLEQPPLANLVRAGQLAGAVQHRRARRCGQERRDDCGHAGHFDGDVADGHPDVGDRVARPRLERADDDAVVAGP